MSPLTEPTAAERIKATILAEIIGHDGITELESVEIQTLIHQPRGNKGRWEAYACYSITRFPGGIPIIGAVEAYMSNTGTLHCLWLSIRG